MAGDKTAEIRLVANVQGFLADMKRAQGALNVTGKDARAMAEHLDYVGNRALAMGAGLLAGLAAMANVSRKYEAAMSDFRAVTQASVEETNMLGEAAQKVGREYGISAAEVVEAGTALAKAGVGVTDVLNGGLVAAVSMSATGSLELADAAEIAAIAMHQFNMEGKDLPLVADMMAKGANEAVGDVRDIAWALRQSGLVAGQFNLDLASTVGTLSLFAQQGLIGSDAGTSFKSMLLAIAGPSGVAKKKMAELGISFYDSNGQFIGLAESADMLQDRLGGLTEEQRNFALSTIFGQDAIRSANILIKEGGDGIRHWTELVNDAGYSSELAQAKLDNLNGDLSKFRVAAENAVLNGSSGLNQSLRDLVQWGTKVADALSAMDPAVAGNVVQFAALTGGALLLFGALSKGVSAFLTMRDHLKDLRSWMDNVTVSGGKTAGAITKIGKALAWGATSLVATQILGNVIAHGAEQVVTRTDFNGVLGKKNQDPGMTRAAVDALFDRQLAESGRKEQYLDHATRNSTIGVDTAMKRVFRPNEVNNIDDFMYTMVGRNNDSTINMMKNTFAQADASIAGMVQSGNMDAAIESFRVFTEAAKENGITVAEVSTLFPEYASSVEQAAVAQGETSVSTERLSSLMQGHASIQESAATETERAAQAQEVLGAAFEATGVTAQGLIGDMEKFLDLLFQTGMLTMSARDAEAAYQESLDGVGDTIQTLIEKYGGLSAATNKSRTDFDLTTEAGRLANSTFQGLAADGMARVEAKAANGMGQPELQQNLKQTYNDLIRAATGMGIEEKAAEALTREILGIPDNVTIDSWMSTKAKEVAEQTNRELDRLNGRRVVAEAITNVITKFRQIGTPSGHEKAAHVERRVYGQGMLAEGGRVVGPGGPKQDNLPYWLSNGEYVLNATDVKALGGFDAIDQWRKELHKAPASFVATATARQHSLVPQMDYHAIREVFDQGRRPGPAGGTDPAVVAAAVRDALNGTHVLLDGRATVGHLRLANTR